MLCRAKPRSWCGVDQLRRGGRHLRPARRATRTGTRARRTVSTPAGTAGRLTPWKPSQPATTSQRSSSVRPSWTKRTTGAVVSAPSIASAGASNSSGRPVASRAATRSLAPARAARRSVSSRPASSVSGTRWPTPSNSSSRPWWTQALGVAAAPPGPPSSAGRRCPARARRPGCVPRCGTGCAAPARRSRCRAGAAGARAAGLPDRRRRWRPGSAAFRKGIPRSGRVR